jgi:hypothetical protein
VPQRLGLLGVLGQRRVEAEELRDGDADRGEREGRAEPGEERPFWFTVDWSVSCYTNFGL